MKIGIPKGLLFYKYNPFITTFFKELGGEIILSPDTNKDILNLGTKYSVDEACLPIKIFHGHAAYLRDKCDIIFLPRIMQLREREYICPKFCGLPEMIINSIPDMPKAITFPIYAYSKKSLHKWAVKTGLIFTKNYFKINKAFQTAIEHQKKYTPGINDNNYKLKVALVGHPYNIYDNFVNMDLVSKLHKMGVGAITEEYVKNNYIDKEVKMLFKRPFWTFTRNSYGFSSYVGTHEKVDGIIYLSSFACGTDSVTVELIKDRLKEFPILVLKLDEHTGEAGLDTRIEAFVDMLQRREFLAEKRQLIIDS
ncbi:acyl-CoA dehydratase activase-related protein [Clostridium tetanomorphum]|uniref:2-hydroxyglutaryl-CoA dehydratase n=1 Tax=Clostridium tetanomorphum TaxID=1553 RepID=A0A923E5V1_CLOTT|nr:acyl-CoA dehydratase activase-related protein [Clostridium tetanomorphum]MBC2397037.1 2-hydroxyglutaryl-CoA dehydratase [Clostridium tetanomorphum]NRZ99121.1 putative nucleotide-binding protein (sugar kinase/HSP70/actin superfamily) [Clostridium tetanomorphum]